MAKRNRRRRNTGRRAARRGSRLKTVVIKRRGRVIARFKAHTDGKKRRRRWSPQALKARRTIGAAARSCVRSRKKPGTKAFGACIRNYMRQHGVNKRRR